MSINGTLAFVILWIVNALIALVYLLVGIFLYVPACDLKREQGEEIQYDNRRAFFIRFIVMVLCPVVGPAFFLCSYLIYKTVFRQAVDLEDVIFSKERVQTHLKADEERERNMAPLEESLAVSDKRNMRMLMLNVIRGDMQKSLESITMALNSEDSETSHYAASVLRDELNDFRSNVQKMYTQMQQETETETECEEMLIDYMNRILSQKIFTTMEQTKYVNMLEEAAESLYQKNGARITADRYEGLCLKLLDLKKIPETEKWCMRLARQHGNALAAYTCRLKLYFTMGEKEKFFEVLQELKESDIIIDNETLELIRILHISNRVTLTAGTVGPFLLVWIWKRRSKIPGVIEWVLENVERLLSGERGKKTSLVQLRGTIYRRFFRGKRKQWLNVLLELAVMGAAIAAITYVYGPNMIEAYGYKASDIPVHNYWINELDRNNIWVAGVYPYGFHIVIYYLHMVFGIKTYVLLRIFGVVQTYFVYLAMVVALKMVCKGRFTPYLGVLFYVMDIFNRNTYARFEGALPQEFSMIFILTSVCMAIRFFQEFAKEQKAEENETKELDQNCRWYLIQFAIGFSLTLTIHFYSTMIAGLFCIGVAVGFCFRFARWKYFRRIMATGILSVLLSVLPMAAGVAMGKGLQGSLYWGLSVINGGKDDETEATDSLVENTELSTISESEGTENRDGGSTVSASQVEALKKAAEEKLAEQAKEQQKPLKERLKEKFAAVRSSIRVNVMNVKPYIVEITLGSIVLLAALGSLMVLLREIDFAGVIFSTAFYLLCMCCLQCASLLHLPALMDPNRCSIFLCYSVCFSWTLGADAIVHLLIRWWKKRWVSNVASILTLVIAVSAVISNGLLRKPIVVDALEDNGAIACVTNILKENRNFTWTICSADDELRMTEFYGYHYETITFLRELQDLEKNPEIIMPTQNVYFFVEKIPIDYAGSTNHKEVTVEGAEAPLPSAGGIEPYFAENRWYTMCHIYYWTQKFKELYPDEMEVYYETDSFICYRVQQNVNSPYNFAIDYGYNNPTPKAGSEEE